MEMQYFFHYNSNATTQQPSVAMKVHMTFCQGKIVQESTHLRRLGGGLPLLVGCIYYTLLCISIRAHPVHKYSRTPFNLGLWAHKMAWYLEMGG